MEEQKKEGVQEYTKEQLKDICDKLFGENQFLKQRLQQAEKFIQTCNRLDYLLRIVEVNNKQERWHFSDDFMAECLKEIEETMTVPEETETKKGN